jgi:hypothetical protein
MEARACTACATAKRRCDKAFPQCLRCRDRGGDCTYPAAIPTCFVLLGEEDIGPYLDELPEPTVPVPVTGLPAFQLGDVGYSGLSLCLDLPANSTELVDERTQSSWFASPETWKIDRYLLLEYNSSTVASLKRLLMKNHGWLADWVEKGSNPFIHARLYHARFPRCIQDAYTTLSCYLRKLASNEQMVFKILEDRVVELVAEHSVPPADSFEHLARVQALLIYQVLCLYDGEYSATAYRRAQYSRTVRLDGTDGGAC